MKVDIAVVTEMCFHDGQDLEQDLKEDGAGLCTLALSRPPNRLGVSHSCVAIITKKSLGNFKKLNVHNPENYEVLPVVGSVQGITRKVVVIAENIPPNYMVVSKNKSKEIMGLSRYQMRWLIEIITGQKNLNYVQSKIHPGLISEMCRFCEEEDKTFEHLLTECPCFISFRRDILKNVPVIKTNGRQELF